MFIQAAFFLVCKEKSYEFSIPDINSEALFSISAIILDTFETLPK